MMSRTDRHSSISLLERRRDELLAVATEVLVAEPGASLASVATAAGVSRSTLHARFPTREGLLREVATRALDTCERVVSEATLRGGGGDRELTYLVAALVPVGPQLSFLWRNPSFDHDPELGARWAGIERDIGAVVARAKESGLLGDGRPIWWDTFTLLALVTVAAESIYVGRLAPLDAPHLVLSTLNGRDEPE
jgi:AcrR family transcriptional regulator